MSASPRIFVTGVSGYLGGHVVAKLVQRHPEWHVVALVRTEEQKKIVLARWPQLEAVVGDLDDSAVLTKEASRADVVLREYSMNSLLGSSVNLTCRNCIFRPRSGRTVSHPGPQ